MNRIGLTDAMSPGDGLIINGRIPMWRDDIQIREGLHIEAFRTGIDLNKQYIRTNRIHDVLGAYRPRYTAINSAYSETEFGQSMTQRVDLSKIVTEGYFPAHMPAFNHVVNDSI